MTTQLLKDIKAGRGKIVINKKNEDKKIEDKKNEERKKEENKENDRATTIKDLIPSPPRDPVILRSRTGIHKLETKVMTDPEAMKVITENHKKKEEKKKKAGEKEKVVQKALQMNRTMKLRQRKGIKSNPKLYV